MTAKFLSYFSFFFIVVEQLVTGQVLEITQNNACTSQPNKVGDGHSLLQKAMVVAKVHSQVVNATQPPVPCKTASQLRGALQMFAIILIAFPVLGMTLRCAGVASWVQRRTSPQAAAKAIIFAQSFVVLGAVHGAVIPVALDAAKATNGSAVLSGLLIGASMAGVFLGLWVVQLVRACLVVPLDKLLKAALLVEVVGGALSVLMTCNCDPPVAWLFFALVLQGCALGATDICDETWLAQLMPGDQNGQELIFLTFYTCMFLGQNVVAMMLTSFATWMGFFSGALSFTRAMAMLTVLASAVLAAQLAVLPTEEETQQVKTNETGHHHDDHDDNVRADQRNLTHRFLACALVETLAMNSAFSVVECANTYIFQETLGWRARKVGLVTGFTGLSIVLGLLCQLALQNHITVSGRVRGLLLLQLLGVAAFTPMLHDRIGWSLAALNVAADFFLFLALYPRHAITEASVLAADGVGSANCRASMLLHCLYFAYTVVPPVTRWFLKAYGRTSVWLLQITLWLVSVVMYEFGIIPYLRASTPAPAQAPTPAPTPAPPAAALRGKQAMMCSGQHCFAMQSAVSKRRPPSAQCEL
mmetsp:Transcript_68906/g.190762  ORF Transcript_68906/g.190762 Transcript_68906/m.190762 type:complete len:586 (-) Transcript_68906:56-1813(-)